MLTIAASVAYRIGWQHRVRSQGKNLFAVSKSRFLNEIQEGENERKNKGGDRWDIRKQIHECIQGTRRVHPSLPAVQRNIISDWLHSRTDRRGKQYFLHVEGRGNDHTPSRWRRVQYAVTCSSHPPSSAAAVWTMSTRQRRRT